MKKQLCILILVILFTGCMNSSSCKQFKVSPADLSWMNTYYQVGDRILFVSEQDTDTLEIISKECFLTPCNKFELGPNQYQECYYSIHSGKSNRDSRTAGLVYSTGNSEFGENKRVFYAFGMYWVTDNIQNDKSVSEESIKVKGIADSIQTLFFDKGNISRGRQEIKSFNWNKKHGLVRYVTLNGEVYEFVKKI